MRIVIECTSAFEAKKLKSQILEDVKNEELETWEHTTAQSGNDIIFHNPDQYVTEPKKNVIFSIDTDDNKVVFSTKYWSKNPQPSKEMYALHTGRLVEVILNQGYSNNFKVIS